MRRTRTIGVVAQGLTDPFYSGFVDSLHQAAARNGFRALFTIQTTSGEEADIFSFLHGKIDGLITIGQSCLSARDWNAFKSQGCPIASIETTLRGEGLEAINVNNEEGAYLAIRHLVQLGHVKIAHLTWNDSYFEAKERMKGFRDALETAQLPVASEWIVQGVHSFHDAYASTMKLLHSPEPPTAVFCFNDELAAGCIHAAKDFGLRIPEQLSVVGFDNRYDALLVNGIPALTTIHQPRMEMAEYAVESVISRLSSNKPAEAERIFPVQLIIRESTAPPSRP